MYLADDAVSEMGLGRGDLVALAYFLGSDYTEGVSGVGIVNAMEVLEAFPMSPSPSAHPPAEPNSDADSSSSAVAGTLGGLRQFKEWLQGYDFTSEVLLLENAAKMTTCSNNTGASLEMMQSLSGSQRKLVSNAIVAAVVYLLPHILYLSRRIAISYSSSPNT